jgi:glutathione S-transferase
MKLYYMPNACSLADHIALEWVGVPYEVVRMDMGALKSPAYLALNPVGAVPLLVHGDFRLTENVAILGYIGDLYPEAGLLGDGTPRARAEVMRWTAYLNSDVHKAFMPIFAPGRFLVDPLMAQPLADNARSHIRNCLRPLNAQLEGRSWLTGFRSIADTYLFVILRWARKLHVDTTDLNHLDRFFERMHADPAVQATLAVEEPETQNA